MGVIYFGGNLKPRFSKTDSTFVTAAVQYLPKYIAQISWPSTLVVFYNSAPSYISGSSILSPFTLNLTPDHLPNRLCSWLLLHVPLAPLPSLRLPLDTLQGCPELCLWNLLTPNCVLTAPSLISSRLPCTYLKYRAQCHPLSHLLLSTTNVGHHRPRSHRFLNYL